MCAPQYGLRIIDDPTGRPLAVLVAADLDTTLVQ
jgi:hypothetical protein